MNVITIELCAEDRARLDKLQAAMERLAGPEIPRAAEALQAVAEAIKPETTEEQLPGQLTIPEEAPEAPEAPKAPEAAPEQPKQPKIEKGDIQKMVVALSGKGKKDAVRSIVLAYGNTKVSDIPEDKLTEVWTKLTALAEG